MEGSTLSSIRLGQEYAVAAEAARQQGLLPSALEYHQQASDAYTAALHSCTDPDLMKTLRLLAASHRHQSQDLRRRRRRVSVLEEPLQKNLRNPKRREDAAAENPYHRFWEHLDDLVQKISLPAAMATAPVGVAGGRSPSLMHLEEDTDDDPESLVFVKNLKSDESVNVTSTRIPDRSDRSERSSWTTSPHSLNRRQQTTAVSAQIPTREQLIVENRQLKQQVDQLSRQLEQLRSLEEENALLKSSLIFSSSPSRRNG